MTAIHILPIATTDADLETVGGKGRSLARMMTAGFPVPGGFFLTTAAYTRFVEENDLQPQILELAKPEIVERAVTFESASERIQTLFEGKPIPDEIGDEIREAYGGLGNHEPAVALRSSANAEDLPDLSFAGQQDTYLNVRGEDAVVSAVRDCWGSLWTARALGYRHENGVDQASVAMAVVVQVMVPSEVSGILFTANPATGKRSEMIVNASFGLGEAIVGGQITPDTYVVDRETLKTKETMIGTKEHMIVSDEQQGTRIADVAVDKRETASLSDALLSELAAKAIEVEQHFDGVPQDIEWAFSDGRLWLLQSRPITNLPPQPLTDVRWEVPEGIPDAIFPDSGGKPVPNILARRKLSEHVPGPVSPLFEDIYVDGAIQNAHVRMVDGYGMDPTGVYAHYKVNGFVYMPGGRPLMKPKLTETPPRRRNPPTPDQTVALWREERVPDYLTAINRRLQIDIDAASNEQLLEGIRELADADADYWFDGFLPVMLLTRQTDSAFQGFLERKGGGFISGQFLTGLKSVAMEAESQLLAVAERIRSDKALHDLVLATPASRLLDTLQGRPNAGPVLEAIGRYLDTYGHQIQTLDFCEPTAREDPTPLMLNLKALVQHTDYDPAAREAELAWKREGVLERANATFGSKSITRQEKLEALLRKAVPEGRISAADAQALAGIQGAVDEGKLTEEEARARFEEIADGRISEEDVQPQGGELLEDFQQLLSAAKRYYPLREEGLFYLGAGWPALRRLALELGRRLAEVDTLASPEDVFYLTGPELEEAMKAQTAGRALPEYQDLTADRFQLREARKRLRVPPQIPMPDTTSGEKEGQGMGGMRIKGGWVLGSVQMQNRPGSDTLEGFACSPGQVTAEASVILSPADFHEMKPGTILVCPMTTPAWTHLFSQAAGLVTDTGGILSHGSIVAREYGIPAVLGTGNITERIVNGQRLSVDGDQGIVEILADD